MRKHYHHHHHHVSHHYRDRHHHHHQSVPTYSARTNGFLPIMLVIRIAQASFWVLSWTVNGVRWILNSLSKTKATGKNNG